MPTRLHLQVPPDTAARRVPLAMRGVALAFATALALTTALAVGCTSAGPVGGGSGVDAPAVTRAVVTKLTDGDTLHVRLAGGAEETVRLIGIDAPEVGDTPEPFGEQASQYVAEMVPLGTDVWLETDTELRDRFGRMLAYVWLDEPQARDEAEVRESMLNALVVLNGYAYAGTYLPNVRYQGILRACQAEANAENRGLWAEHEPERQ